MTATFYLLCSTNFCKNQVRKRKINKITFYGQKSVSGIFGHSTMSYNITTWFY